MHSAAYSSVWRWTSVAMRHVASMESPSKTPKVILVFPMSTARSIPPLQRPLYGMRPVTQVSGQLFAPEALHDRRDAQGEIRGRSTGVAERFAHVLARRAVKVGGGNGSVEGRQALG